MIDEINIKAIQQNSKDILRRVKDLTAMLRDIEDTNTTSDDAAQIKTEVEAVRFRLEDLTETLQAQLNGLNVLAEFFFQSDSILSQAEKFKDRNDNE